VRARDAAPLVVLCVAIVAAPLRAQGRLASATKDSAVVVYDDDGLRIHSSDGRRQLRLRGYLALDARLIPSDRNDAEPNTFAIRRARIFFDLNVNPWLAFRLLPDLAGTTQPIIADGFADVSFSKTWWLRAGKQKVPYGWERTISISDQGFPERSIVSQLSSNRDEGVTVTGEFGDGRAEITAGLFNGVPDGGANGDGDLNDAKDAVLRVVTHPLIRKGGQGLTLGYSGSHGVMRVAGTATGLPHFATPGMATFFQYRETAGAVSDGDRTRHNLFAVARLGSLGFFAEGYRTEQHVRRATTLSAVATEGAFAQIDWVATGELSQTTGITPAKLFDPEHGQWGALQFLMRVATVRVGDAAFPILADPTVAARGADELTVGATWYFTRNTKTQIALEQTTFRGGAATGNRPTEQLALLRLQTSF
jgi:phosphate-selective porin OprO/OprP